MHILINKKYLTFNNYKAKCAIGKRGIGYKKKEGDLITPKGRYKIKYILYRKDRVKKIYSKIKKIAIENLYKKENIYDIVIVLNYNMNPIIRNKGSAIFIHVARKNYQKTEGCVAIKKKHLIQIIKELKRNTKVKIENRK